MKQDVSRYDRSYASRPYELRIPGDAVKDRIIYRVISRAPHDGKCLLDLGCGMGHTASMLSDLVDVTGIDFSAQAISVANKKSSGTFLCGDVEALPFPDGEFDFVVAKDIIEHIPDDNRVMDEIRRVCRHNAMVILYLPRDFKGWNFSTEAIVQKLTGYTLDEEVGHLRRYTPQQAKDMLEKRGFGNFKTWDFVHFSLGIVSLLSVKGYALMTRGKQRGDKVISDKTLPLLKCVFKLAELVGQVEASLFQRLPGAGFFIQADLRD